MASYAITALAALIGAFTAVELGLPCWPGLAILLIGYTGGRVAGYFAKD